MARESFEDLEIADILNKYYVSVKVDKEERPDIDSIYMAVCQAFTGRGGWPVSIFMTAEQKPFFAGTYFPKTARYWGRRTQRTAAHYSAEMEERAGRPSSLRKQNHGGSPSASYSCVTSR